jgi:hypothetical protein
MRGEASMDVVNCVPVLNEYGLSIILKLLRGVNGRKLFRMSVSKI